jgi:hypothetical protein
MTLTASGEVAGEPVLQAHGQKVGGVDVAEMDVHAPVVGEGGVGLGQPQHHAVHLPAADAMGGVKAGLHGGQIETDHAIGGEVAVIGAFDVEEVDAVVARARAGGLDGAVIESLHAGGHGCLGGEGRQQRGSEDELVHGGFPFRLANGSGGPAAAGGDAHQAQTG